MSGFRGSHRTDSEAARDGSSILSKFWQSGFVAYSIRPDIQAINSFGMLCVASDHRFVLKQRRIRDDVVLSIDVSSSGNQLARDLASAPHNPMIRSDDVLGIQHIEYLFSTSL